MKLRSLIPFLFFAPLLHAAGGTCPSGANYTNLANPTGSLVTLSSYGVTSCYFVSAAGADTNNGTTESTPWLHAPQMPNCANTCATVQSAISGTNFAGTGIIFRGGDTWHVGASTAPSTGGTWNFNAGGVPIGTSSHPIYIGVDPTWFTGGSWARPIFTGDNPLCNASTVGTGGCTLYTGGSLDQTYYVTSCAHQNGGSNNRMFDMSFVSYYITDNLEMTGLCESGLGQAGHNDDYIDIGGLNGPQWFTNDYIHGWSHLSFGGNNGSGGCTGSTTCFNIFAFDGSTIANGPPNVTELKVVIDGLDSDPGGAGMCFGSTYDIAYSVILYTSQCISNDFHLFHDNIYADFYENGHANMLESNNQAETAGTNAFYNNVLYALETTGGTGGYGIALSPPVGTTDYIFNNIWWNVGDLQSTLTTSSSNSANLGSLIAFNNTFQLQSGLMVPIVSCPPASITTPTTFVNNHYITDNGTVYNASNCSGSKTPTTLTNLTMTNSTATTDGYTNSEPYVFSPPLISSPTVGTGTNKNTAYCGALTTAAVSDPTLSDAAAKCLDATTYGVTYNATNHTATPNSVLASRPSSAAWDIGAYQGVPASSSPAPAAPQLLFTLQ